MREEILKAIRDEANKEITNLEGYNAYVRFRNELAVSEETTQLLGLPYTRNMKLLEKKESDVIMSAYKKYFHYIGADETNGIYVYVGSYMPNESFDDLSSEDSENEASFEVEVDINDPRVTHRRYWNLEGIWAKTIAVDECEEFERTHTVIYADNFSNLQREFIMTAVKESQEEAVSRVLKRYKKH